MIRLAPWFIIAALAFAGAAQWYGYRAGYDAAMTEQRLAQAAANDRQAIAEREQQELQARRDAIARQLEDQAHADPVASPACLPLSRVRRINLR